MLRGSDVHWWGSVMPDFANLTANDFIISKQTLNDTYTNATFVLHLRSNVTWDRIRLGPPHPICTCCCDLIKFFFLTIIIFVVVVVVVIVIVVVFILMILIM